MIASNYIKHPAALRFQCEMFSNGYKNSPRIMRLMTVIFDWKLQAPQWVKDAMAKAKRLVKMCREQQMELFPKFDTTAIIKERAKPLIEGYYYGPTGETWTGRGQVPRWLRTLIDQGQSKETFKYENPFKETVPGRWKISLQINRNNAEELDRCGGLYRSLCRAHQNWASGNDFNMAYSNHSFEMDMGISV